MAGWIGQIAEGQQVDVDSDVVDALNAEHASQAAAVTRAEATEHLRRSGAAMSALVAGLSTADLAADDGRIRLFAQISARHADNHRTEIAAALAAEHPASLLRPE